MTFASCCLFSLSAALGEQFAVVKGDLSAALSWLASERAVKELLAVQLKEAEARPPCALTTTFACKTSCRVPVRFLRREKSLCPYRWLPAAHALQAQLLEARRLGAGASEASGSRSAPSHAQASTPALPPPPQSPTPPQHQQDRDAGAAAEPSHPPSTPPATPVHTHAPADGVQAPLEELSTKPEASRPAALPATPEPSPAPPAGPSAEEAAAAQQRTLAERKARRHFPHSCLLSFPPEASRARCCAPNHRH